MKWILVVGALAVAGLAVAGLPGQIPCTTETHACSSGSCSRPVPDGGAMSLADGGGVWVPDADSGVSLAYVQGYTVRVCGTVARPLAGAGTLKDYHITSTGVVTELTRNARSVTLSGGPPYCQELPPFVIPAFYPQKDRMVWASSGVTISNWDGGAADTVTVTVCPAQ